MTKCLLLLTIFLLFIPIGASGAEVGLGVTKNTFDLEILPGDFYEGNLTVFNKSKEVPLPVHIQLSLWNLKEDSEDIEFVKAESALNAAKWFAIPEGQDLILDPGGSRQITFRIEPPEDVTPGSYFVMMRFGAVLPEHYFVEQGPRFLPEVGVLFFIRAVDWTLEGSSGGYNAEIVGLEPKNAKPLPFVSRFIPEAKAGIFEDVVTELTAKLKNTGIYHFQASGFIEIQNMFGMRVARAELPKRYLLPNRTRKIDLNAAGEELSFLRKFPFAGPYKAIMALDIPQREEPIVAELHFWVFPWKEAFAGLFIIGLFLFARGRIWKAGKALVVGSK